MSKPKLLRIFDETTESIAYSKINNPVSIRKKDTSLVVDQSLKIYDRAVLTFRAPCSCQGIKDIKINNISYTIVNPLGSELSDINYFNSGASVSIIIDELNKKAYIMNPAIESDWLEAEGRDGYIKNRPNIIAGHGSNSIVSNDIINNKAYSENSSVIGSCNAAGSRVFRILSIDPEYHSYLLSSTKGISELLVDGALPTRVSVYLSSDYEDVGVIVGVSGDEIYLSNIITEEGLDFDNSYYYLKILDHPELGDYVIGEGAYSEGYKNISSGKYSHTEGYKNISSGKYSHTEGRENFAGEGSHSEGYLNKSTGKYSHSEGYNNLSEGDHSHAEGKWTKSVGEGSHSEGINTIAKGRGSHAGGIGTIAHEDAQRVVGTYNKQSKAKFVVGDGADEDDRSNALEVYGKDTTDSGEAEAYVGGKRLLPADMSSITRGKFCYVGEDGLLKTDDIRMITTINGEDLFFFVGTQEEYVSLSDEEKAHLFAIITDDMSKQELLDIIDTLEGKHDTLREDHDILQGEHDTLLESHNTLESSHNTLQESHNTLQESHNTLQESHNTLRGEHDTLREDHDTLIGKLNSGELKVADAYSSDYAERAENATYATYAALDSKGNNIVETYATKTELSREYITESQINGKLVWDQFEGTEFTPTKGVLYQVYVVNYDTAESVSGMIHVIDNIDYILPSGFKMKSTADGTVSKTDESKFTMYYRKISLR